jgi:hypothetical protein
VEVPDIFGESKAYNPIQKHIWLYSFADKHPGMDEVIQFW